MNFPPQSIARFSRLIGEFGALRGGQLWWKLFRGDPLVNLPFPADTGSVPGELKVRSKSADTSVYLQVVLDDTYANFRTSLPQSSVEVIVDAGAHIGCASRMFHATFPSARILAIEPSRDNFQLLMANVGQYQNVSCINAALWSSDGHLAVQRDSTGSTWGFTTSAVGDIPGEEVVPARSLPSLMNEFGIDKIDLLKIDIEGAEREVFGETAGEWLHKVRSLVVEVHERMYPGCAEVVSTALRGFTGKTELLHE